MRKHLSSRIPIEVLAKQHKKENQSSSKQSLRELIPKKAHFQSTPKCAGSSCWMAWGLSLFAEVIAHMGSEGRRVFLQRAEKMFAGDAQESICGCCWKCRLLFFGTFTPVWERMQNSLRCEMQSPQGLLLQPSLSKSAVDFRLFVQLKVAGTAAEWPLKWNFFPYKILCTYDVQELLGHRWNKKFGTLANTYCYLNSSLARVYL